MKRHVKYLTLTALSVALALQAGAVWAGGFSFGGGRGGGGGGGGGGMSFRSGGSSMGGNFRSLSSGGNFSARPKMSISGNSSFRSLGANQFHGMNKPQGLGRVSQGNPLLNQGGVTGGLHNKLGSHPGVMKQAGGPLGGPRVPGVTKNVLTGNVKSHLIGNGTGVNPRQILGGPNKPGGQGLGIKIGGAQGGPAVRRPGIAGGVAGGKVGGVIGKIGGSGPAPAKIGGGVGISIGNKIGGHHSGKFCGTPWPGHPHKGKSDCHHVINLLVQHCMAKNHYEPCVKRYCPPQHFVETGWIPPPPVAIALPGQPAPGDLELVDVAMITDATDELGPLYQVTIRNAGEVTAEQFRVSMVAVLGEITEDSPSVTLNVDRLAPGESATLQVQLPGAVLAMGPEGETAVPFDTLVVAVDSFDELVEGNELNNVATLKRAEITIVQVETVATETTVAAPAEGEATAPALEAAPAEGAPEAAPEATEELPAAEGEAPAPTDNAGPMDEIDIDSLDLGEADSAALFVK